MTEEVIKTLSGTIFLVNYLIISYQFQHKTWLLQIKKSRPGGIPVPLSIYRGQNMCSCDTDVSNLKLS